jgi:hypothetical protein
MPAAPADIRDRVETDASDATIQALIDEAAGEIISRYGPYRNVAEPITVDVAGRRRRLDVWRPIDTGQTVSIVEHWVADDQDVFSASDYEGWLPDTGETTTGLDSTDFRIWNGGRTVERLYTGTHPMVYWGSRVEITYVPVDDTKQRDEVVRKLAIIGLAYQGLISQQVGDVQFMFGLRSASGGGSPLIYVDERERLLSSLQPRKGLMLR